MLRLSLTVITKNEENNIERCLGSVPFASEKIVVDSGSSDRTVELARSLGARVIETPDWPGVGPQKNRAMDAATGDWILSLDADEWLEKPLADEILATLRDNRTVDGYYIPRRSRFCGVVVRHSGWYPDHVMRLFRRGKGHFSSDLIHDHVDVDGEVAYLKEPIEHDSIVDFADAESKIEKYSNDVSKQLVAEGKKSNLFKAYLRGGWAFVKAFVLRAGFLDGKTGWRVANYHRRYTYRKWARVAAATKQKS